MEHEIVLKTTEDLVLPQITPDLRRRQVDFAWGQRPQPDLDLSETALDHCLSKLGGLEPGTTAFLVVPEANRRIAGILGKSFNLAVICLPDEVMKNTYVWAVVSAKGAVYSTPTP